MPCMQFNDGSWMDEWGFPCTPPLGGGGGGVIQVPPSGGGGGAIYSPSTVWTGQGTYSRTLQAILSGIGLWRGAQTVPVPTQLIAAQNPSYGGGVIGGIGGGAYGNQTALPGGRPGTNFSGQAQALIEAHPGYVAIALAIAGAFVVGSLKKKSPAYR